MKSYVKHSYVETPLACHFLASMLHADIHSQTGIVFFGPYCYTLFFARMLFANIHNQNGIAILAPAYIYLFSSVKDVVEPELWRCCLLPCHFLARMLRADIIYTSFCFHTIFLVHGSGTPKQRCENEEDRPFVPLPH